MATAARWTGRALRTAWGLGDPGLLAAVLRMHGNELRKAGHPAAAIIRLRQSLELETDPARTGSGLVLLARAAGSGQAGLFDAATTECRRLLPAGAEVLFSKFTVRETRLRGLLATGRARQAVDLAETIPPVTSLPPRSGALSNASPPPASSPPQAKNTMPRGCSPRQQGKPKRSACPTRSSASSGSPPSPAPCPAQRASARKRQKHCHGSGSSCQRQAPPDKDQSRTGLTGPSPPFRLTWLPPGAHAPRA